MTQPSLPELYTERQRRFQAETERWATLSRTISNLRGLSFGALVVSSLLALLGESPGLSGSIALVSLVLFAFFVRWHASVEAKEESATRWAEVNADALLRVSGRFRELPDDGAVYAPAQHPYAADLDLFGKASLFQRLGVARTSFGQRTLASWLSEPATLDKIERRQAAVAELKDSLELRQELEALALGVVEHRRQSQSKERILRRPPDTQSLLKWSESEPLLMKQKALALATRVLPLITVGLGIAWSRGLSPIPFVILLVVQLLVLIATRPAATAAFVAVSKHEGAFLRYGAMLALLEKLPAQSPELVAIRERLQKSGATPSELMARFERIVGYFDLRHNGLIHPFADLVLLWDNQCTLALENWQLQAGKELRGWFEAIGEFEALSSFAAFLHDEPGAVFPVVSEGPAHYRVEALAHPLLPAGKRIANDVALPEPGSALLVTGSNMSGKSTMLRAMGLSGVMALAGAPVCARRLELSPIILRTSIRVADSLEQGVSHFYAEVSKLKSALDGTETGTPVMFLLDEILHGTNSRERQIGARWVLAELIKRGAIGAVSTHDQELCALTPELMKSVSLVHFRETVSNGEMTFDYKLRPGPVRGGNALRLMQLVGLPVPLDEP
jgi:hypothetical protein